MLAGERVDPDLQRGRVHSDDGIQAAIGDPGRIVRTDDDAVGRRGRPQPHHHDLTRGWIEPAHGPVTLPRVPDPAEAVRHGVMRAAARRNGVLLDHQLTWASRSMPKR